MKKFLLLIALLTSTFCAFAQEPSECDGISTWKKVAQNSPDVMMRTCTLFGMNFIEVKSQLNESRCIAIRDAKTGNDWKHFFLHNRTIKALANPYLDPSSLTIASKDPVGSSCSS